MAVERKDEIADFLEADEAYPGQTYHDTYTGTPEFDVAELENY